MGTRPGSRRYAALLLAAIFLTGMSMRTAVTSVGAVLDDVETGLGAGSAVSGVLTTLPVLCFSGLGALTPRLAHRHGAHRLLVVALAVMTVGLVLRALAGSVPLFLVFSVLALSGGAVSNVLMPSLVRRHFPDRIGRMTAVYTTALAIGMTAAAGLTVPIGELGSGWRTGLGVWALLSAAAVLPWLPTLRHDRPEPGAPAGLPPMRLVRSPTAWALTVFFAFQSFQAYVAFGWFAKFLHDQGVSSATAGWMVAALAAVSIPVSMVVPSIAPQRQRAVIALLALCYLVAYVGLVVAPVGGAWVWMVLTGIGSGMFPISLTMIARRARTPETTAALSAFVQAIGYVVAGTGPLLFGILHGVTGGWSASLSLLFVALVLALVSGWRSCLPHFVDDELAESRA